MELFAVAVTVGALVKSITGMGLPPSPSPSWLSSSTPPDAVSIMTLTTVVTKAHLAWYRDAAGETEHLGKTMVAGVIGTAVGVYFLTSLDATAVGLDAGSSTSAWRSGNPTWRSAKVSPAGQRYRSDWRAGHCRERPGCPR